MDDLVRVHTAGTATEGHLLRGLLEAEGIPVHTNGEGDGPYRTGTLHLWVAEAFEIQARLLIEEAARGDRSIGSDPEST